MSINCEMVGAVLFFGGLILGIVVGVYQAYAAHLTERKFSGIMNYSDRQSAIYDYWRKHHRFMPYTGSDVGWFIGLVAGIPISIGFAILFLDTFMIC